MTDLEKIILRQVENSIGQAIINVFAGYNSPLTKLVEEVFEEERGKVSSIMKTVMGEVVSAPEFRTTIKEEFNRKVAKFLVGSMEGQVKKAVDILKQDPTFKSRMILAIESIVETELTSLNKKQ